MLTPDMQNGLFALGGALIGSLFPSVTSWLKHRSEERKHLREIASRMAAESWRMNLKLLGKTGPLEHHLIYSLLIAKVAAEENLSPELLKKKLDEIDAIMRVAVDHSYYLRDRNMQEGE